MLASAPTINAMPFSRLDVFLLALTLGFVIGFLVAAVIFTRGKRR